MRFVIRGLFLLLGQVFVFALLAGAQLGNSGSTTGCGQRSIGRGNRARHGGNYRPVSGYSRTTSTDTDGSFHFTNVPFNRTT